MLADGLARYLWRDICVIVTMTLPGRRHPMEIFPALLAYCEGNSPVTGEFPTQRPLTQDVDVFFDLRLNQQTIETPVI